MNHNELNTLKMQMLDDEVEQLVQAVFAGITVVPNAMVSQPTLLVRPEIYEALRERIDRDTEKFHAGN